MASGIIMKTPRVSESSPPKKTGKFGIDRRPETKPPDFDKLLTAGTALAKSAETYVYRACDLFLRLDHFARTNRTNLTDPDALQVLAGTRVEAEGWLERGFHAFDSALQALTRLGRYEPGFADRRVDRGFCERRKSYFLALGQVVGSVFARIYEAVLATPTCGELSAIPPWVYVNMPEITMRQRYDRRYDICRTTGHLAAAEYWRRRNVRAVESRELEGEVVTIQPPSDGGDGPGGAGDLQGGPAMIHADDGRAAEQQLLGEARLEENSNETPRKSQRIKDRKEKREGLLKRKRDSAESESPYSPPRWKRRTRPFVLRVGPGEGQNMNPLTNEELAQLPWNAGLKRIPADDKGKIVVPHHSSRWWDIARFPYLMAWSRLEKPPVDFGYESERDDTDSGEAEISVPHVDLSSEPAEPASEEGAGSTGQGPSSSLPENSTPDLPPARRHATGSPSTGASQTPPPSTVGETTMYDNYGYTSTPTPARPADETLSPPGFATFSTMPAARSTGANPPSGGFQQMMSSALVDQVDETGPGGYVPETEISPRTAEAISSLLDDDALQQNNTQGSDNRTDGRSDNTWLQMSNQEPYQVPAPSDDENSDRARQVWRV